MPGKAKTKNTAKKNIAELNTLRKNKKSREIPCFFSCDYSFDCDCRYSDSSFFMLARFSSSEQ